MSETPEGGGEDLKNRLSKALEESESGRYGKPDTSSVQEDMMGELGKVRDASVEGARKREAASNPTDHTDRQMVNPEPPKKGLWGRLRGGNQ